MAERGARPAGWPVGMTIPAGGAAVPPSKPRGLLVLAAVIASALLVVSGVALGEDLSLGYAYLLPVAIPFVAVGALLASKVRANPIGWLFLAFGCVASFVFAAGEYSAAAFSSGSSLPACDLAASIYAHFWHPSFGLLVFSLLLFPNGHLLSPRWRWMARVVAATYIGLLVSGPFDRDYLSDLDLHGAQPLFGGTLADVGSIVFGVLLTFNLLLLLIAGVSLLLRLHRTSGEQRQQVKVFVYAVACVMFFFPISVLIVGDGAVGVLTFPLIPISAAVAILRYRLYDIDVVINRTLVYGALTATLAGTYVGTVLLLQLALGGVTGDSGLAVAVSTLAVAALFRPARSRIQAAVDRRFYRRKFDAQRTLAAFAARLRDEVALDALSAELRGVVAETMQPAHVSLWLRGEMSE
jgi:hypothetical protein